MGPTKRSKRDTMETLKKVGMEVDDSHELARRWYHRGWGGYRGGYGGGYGGYYGGYRGGWGHHRWG